MLLRWYNIYKISTLWSFLNAPKLWNAVISVITNMNLPRVRHYSIDSSPVTLLPIFNEKINCWGVISSSLLTFWVHSYPALRSTVSELYDHRFQKDRTYMSNQGLCRWQLSCILFYLQMLTAVESICSH